jgi:uncharacterized protein YjgD (DUF1641 family)
MAQSPEASKVEAKAPLPPAPEVPPEVQAQALAQLLDAIVGLKRSGLLGLLSYIADRAEESFLTAATDPALMRLLAVLASLQRGITRVDAVDLSRAQNNLEDLTSCAFKALGSVDLSQPRRIGLFGLLNKLNDPDISQGLGILLDIAKGLGSCVRAKSKA